MPSRVLRIVFLLLPLLGGNLADAATWSIEGDELRQRHADTLEDLLREVPFLRVNRFGAAGLPFDFGLDAQRGERILLVLDGLPFHDDWSGANLCEELPLSLVERVEVDLSPSPVEYGSDALAGVIRVWTRRNASPNVSTRIHLSRATFAERTRRLSFETPPGATALAVGLDEFFSDGYLYSQVWNGEAVPVTATPEVEYSRRRALIARLDLDAAALGPLEMELLQSSWHMDMNDNFDSSWYRDVYQVTLRLGASPFGRVILAHRALERRALFWRSVDSSLRLRWDGNPIDLILGRLAMSGGARRHQLSANSFNERRALPRPSILWTSALWDGEWDSGFDLEGGLRLETEWKRSSRLFYQTRMGWSPPARRARLALFFAGGEPDASWGLDRLPNHLIWPAGLSEPDTDPPRGQTRRVGLSLDWHGDRAWMNLQAWRESGDLKWLAREEGQQEWQFQGIAAEPRNTAALQVGSRWDGRLGRADAWGSVIADLDAAEEPYETYLRYPYQARGHLRIGRPFFSSDARLTLGGGVEYRDGLEDHEPLLRFELEAELRIIEARFWLRYRNALDWAGEEIPGYPISPSSLHLGIDWHLDH